MSVSGKPHTKLPKLGVTTHITEVAARPFVGDRITFAFASCDWVCQSEAGSSYLWRYLTGRHAIRESVEFANAARPSTAGSRSPVRAQSRMFLAIATRLWGVRKSGGNDCTT